MAAVVPVADPTFLSWLQALAQRHLSNLSFAEVRRGIQALSAWYVERRDRARPGIAFDGRGKRAAFALFYTPLHYLTVAGIVEATGLAAERPTGILDLGCGTGPAGAAWSRGFSGGPVGVVGADTSGWTAGEARWNWARLGVPGTTRRSDLTRVRIGRRRAVVLAWVVNELSAGDRVRLAGTLVAAIERGASVLVVEPIARSVVPWWDEWTRLFERAGGRADTWRFACELPEPLRSLDRAAALDHRELTARSLCVQSRPSS
ncbi:MAG TPA: class I SAM-dependent methyltransferase [Candidatus Polarisedimenticolaceae bacterium]|nr:class I SAM-dependent methyltransferase [Candidatus Polarisedimenticolaceae bacterium]